MSYISAALGIIAMFAWAVFLLNSQLKEIRSLKAQLSIERDYSQDLDNSLSVCKGDVDYLKNGLEDVIRASKDMR